MQYSSAPGFYQFFNFSFLSIASSPQSTSQEFANHLRTEWKFGACDNTVLILLVADADEVVVAPTTTVASRKVCPCHLFFLCQTMFACVFQYFILLFCDDEDKYFHLVSSLFASSLLEINMSAAAASFIFCFSLLFSSSSFFQLPRRLIILLLLLPLPLTDYALSGGHRRCRLRRQVL